MAEKCELCGEKIKEGFMWKLNGTIVSTVEDKKRTKHYVCRDCQIKHGKNLKEAVEKI